MRVNVICSNSFDNYAPSFFFEEADFPESKTLQNVFFVMLFIIENRNLFKKVIGFQRTFFSAHTDCSKLEKLVKVDFYDVIKYMTSDYLQDF